MIGKEECKQAECVPCGLSAAHKHEGVLVSGTTVIDVSVLRVRA